MEKTQQKRNLRKGAKRKIDKPAGRGLAPIKNKSGNYATGNYTYDYHVCNLKGRAGKTTLAFSICHNYHP